MVEDLIFRIGATAIRVPENLFGNIPALGGF